MKYFNLTAFIKTLKETGIFFGSLGASGCFGIFIMLKFGLAGFGILTLSVLVGTYFIFGYIDNCESIKKEQKITWETLKK